MTTIKVLKSGKNILSIECKGHSGYAEKGFDIVCSAISATIGACVLGLQKIVKIELKCLQDDEKGYFFLKIKENSNASIMEKAQVLLKTTALSLFELSKDYKNYIKIKCLQL